MLRAEGWSSYICRFAKELRLSSPCTSRGGVKGAVHQRYRNKNQLLISMLQLSRALALTLLIVSSAFGDGGFLTSCDPDSIEIDGTIMTASCLNVFKESKCSRLDLGSCFKNDYGSIQNDPSGNG